MAEDSQGNAEERSRGPKRREGREESERPIERNCGDVCVDPAHKVDNYNAVSNDRRIMLTFY
jgi:hypothetical protein